MSYIENTTWRREVQKEMLPLQRRPVGNNQGRDPKNVQILCHWINRVGIVEWQD